MYLHSVALTEAFSKKPSKKKKRKRNQVALLLQMILALHVLFFQGLKTRISEKIKHFEDWYKHDQVQASDLSNPIRYT